MKIQSIDLQAHFDESLRMHVRACLRCEGAGMNLVKAVFAQYLPPTDPLALLDPYFEEWRLATSIFRLERQLREGEQGNGFAQGGGG